MPPAPSNSKIIYLPTPIKNISTRYPCRRRHLPAVPATTPPCDCDAFLAICPPSLPSLLSREKEEGPLQALLLPEGLVQESLIDKHQQRYQKIPRFALILLALSPWRKLLASQNDQVYITMTQ